MKINEVEAAVGVTKKNIRFYEEEGLITPSREPGNGYRSYSQADVERLRDVYKRQARGQCDDPEALRHPPG